METKKYDLEDRTRQFTINARKLTKQLSSSASNHEDSLQLIGSSGSVGANYIEANGALGKRDFQMRIRICRKEARESGYWLRVLGEFNEDLKEETNKLYQESLELTKIFSTILAKSM